MPQGLSKAKALDQYVKVRAELAKVQNLLADLLAKRDSLYQIVVGEERKRPGMRSGQVTTQEWVHSRGGSATPEEVAKRFGISRVQAYSRCNSMCQRGFGTYKDGTFTLNSKSMKEVA